MANLLHKVVQVAMFTALACSVVFGLSRQGGDLIITTIVGLVQLVMLSNPMKTFSTIHADIF